tara:strand:- start:7004 stop:7171 length:168 start_codon:yes stop_codon:yes gene_type:complete
MKMDEDLAMYFDFLEDLQESGDTNMFGAVPYLIDEFALDRSEALNILTRWMETYQ